MRHRAPSPLPLGPLPLPPGPLNAKHSKRAQGAVFNGTHSPVRSEPSSPPPGSPQRDGGHPAIAPGAVLHVRFRRVTTSFCAVGAKLRAVPLAKSPRAEWVGSQKFDSCSLHSLGQLPMRADESESDGPRFATIKVPRKQLQFTECDTGLQITTGSYFSSPNATQGCKTRPVRRGPISGPLSGPSGSPRSPAEPHPPSLAWVETLGRLRTAKGSGAASADPEGAPARRADVRPQ